MAKLIIITGDIATGKTTFSKQLSERYNIEAYTKDSIKEILADDIGFSNREENLALSRAAVSIMTQIFEKHAEVGKDLILEANFHKDEIEKLRELAKANKADILTLVLEADIDILYSRFKHRVEFENRHPAHQSAGLDSIEAFEKYVLSSREDVETGDCIRLKANDFSYRKDPILLEKIDGFMR